MKKFLSLLALMLMTSISAWADSMSAILAASTNETTPEYQYKVQPRNANDYWWSSTTTTCNNIDNAGKFAFYAAEGEGNYYIYSVDAQQWLSYEKAASYDGKRNFVTLVDEKASANYFKAVKGLSTSGYASNDKSGYTFSPYKSDDTVAPTYLNWFQGAGSQGATDKVGVYGTQWGDAGSVWIMIPADDATKTKSVELWRAEIAAYNNIVGLGYSSADYASTEDLNFDGILEWKASHTPLAFDPTKLYRVWNNSQVQGCSWTIGNNGVSVAWAARDNDDNTQVWKFVQVDAENEYKYIIQNYGTPTAFMPGSLGGNSFHNHVVAKNAAKYAINASDNGFFQIHNGTATGAYIFADSQNHLDGWQGDGKDKWYLELVDVEEYIIANGNTETISSILTTHENVGNIIVEEGATLNIDADMTDFNMARITTCPGADVLVSNTTADIATLLGHTNVSINLENYSITGNKQTVATGQLTIGSGKKLTIGGGDGQTNSVSSFTSVFVDGGTIYHNNQKETLHNVTLNAGTLQSFDMGTPGNNASEGTFTNAWILEGTTTVTSNSYILSNWNAQYDIKKLAGEGTLKLRGNGANNEGAAEPTYYAIRDVEEFTGAFDILNTNGRFTNVLEGIKITNGIKVNTISLKDITLVGNERINTQGTVTIDGVVANDITSSTNGYALVQGGNTTLNLKSNIDFTQNSNGETTTHSKLGYQTVSAINILEDANVKCGGAWWSKNTNCAPINIATGATLVGTDQIWANNIENNGHIKIEVDALVNSYINTATITGDNFDVVLTGAALNARANGDYTVVSCSSENAATNVTVNSESEFLAGSRRFTVAKDNNNIKLTKAADALYAKAQEYESYVGTGLGKYHFNETETSGLMDAVEATTTVESRTALVNSIAINQPEVGKFYTIKNAGKFHKDGTNHYWNGTWVSTELDKNTIFYLAEDNCLVQFGTGNFANGTNVASEVVAEPQTYTFHEARTTWGTKNNGVDVAAYGDYCIHGSSMNGSLMTWENSAKGTMDGDADPWAAWIIEEVESLPVALTQVGDLAYASFNAPVAVKVPEDVTAYGAEINGNVLELSEFSGGNLAAKTPVILTTSTGGGTYNFNIVESGVKCRSDLQGTIAKQNVADGKTTYVLNKSGDKIGFYKSTSFINGFKAYCEVDNNNALSNALSFRFDDILTAIEAIQSENSGAEIYDLQGRRLNKAQKGMNIINGHKVLVK